MKFLSRLVYQTFNGYVFAQFRKMVRSMQRKDEPNWKHAMHLLRLLEVGTRTLETGALELRTEHRDDLLAVRAGDWSWERVDAWRQSLHTRFETAFAQTALPERPDYAVVNDFLVQARRGEYGEPA